MWQEALRLLDEYSEKYSEIQVTMGPVFDYNYDGKADTEQHIIQ